MEQGALRVAGAGLNNIFRSYTHSIEREMSQVTQAVASLSTRLAKSSPAPPSPSSSAPTSSSGTSSPSGTEDTKSSPIIEEAASSVGALVARLQGLKRKLEDCKRAEERQLARCKARLDHIKQAPVVAEKAAEESHDTALLDAWQRRRTDRLVVEYLLREGYLESASLLAAQRNLKDLTDVEVFTAGRKVTEALRSHNCAPALTWCAENRVRLHKLKSTLEFNLRLQEFVELVRVDALKEAILYARKHLAPAAAKSKEKAPGKEPAGGKEPTTSAKAKAAEKGRDKSKTSIGRRAEVLIGQAKGKEKETRANRKDDDGEDGEEATTDLYMAKLQRAMGLLAFRKDTECAIYKYLLEEDRWEDLVHQFEYDLLQLHSMPREPLLLVALQAGLTSLKTHQCYTTAEKTANCPVCDERIGQLAEPLPFSQRTKSSVICPITKEHFDNDTYAPLVLPNGYVYSKLALEDMALHNDGVVTCPRTGASFTFDQAKKAFIV